MQVDTEGIEEGVIDGFHASPAVAGILEQGQAIRSGCDRCKGSDDLGAHIGREVGGESDRIIRDDRIGDPDRDDLGVDILEARADIRHRHIGGAEVADLARRAQVDRFDNGRVALHPGACSGLDAVAGQEAGRDQVAGSGQRVSVAGFLACELGQRGGSICGVFAGLRVIIDSELLGHIGNVLEGVVIGTIAQGNECNIRIALGFGNDVGRRGQPADLSIAGTHGFDQGGVVGRDGDRELIAGQGLQLIGQGLSTGGQGRRAGRRSKGHDDRLGGGAQGVSGRGRRQWRGRNGGGGRRRQGGRPNLGGGRGGTAGCEQHNGHDQEGNERKSFLHLSLLSENRLMG